MGQRQMNLEYVLLLHKKFSMEFMAVRNQGEHAGLLEELFATERSKERSPRNLTTAWIAIFLRL